MRATDEAGNTDPSPAEREFTVDTTAPQTTITAGPTGLINEATPSFSFSSSEPGSSFECRLDSGSFGACSSPYTAPTLTDGPHSFEVRATDEAGNTDPSPAEREFTVDTTAPASQASSPAATNSTAITVSYAASDAGPGLATVELWAKPPGSPSYAKVATDTSPEASGSFDYTAEAGDGSYAFYTRATDRPATTRSPPARLIPPPSSKPPPPGQRSPPAPWAQRCRLWRPGRWRQPPASPSPPGAFACSATGQWC